MGIWVVGTSNQLFRRDSYRKRTLSMQEKGSEGFTNFSKTIRSPGHHRTKYFMAQ